MLDIEEKGSSSRSRDLLSTNESTRDGIVASVYKAAFNQFAPTTNFGEDLKIFSISTDFALESSGITVSVTQPYEDSSVISTLDTVFNSSIAKQSDMEFGTSSSGGINNSNSMPVLIETGYQSMDIRTLGIVIGIFDICVGSVGNLLTLIAILCNKKLQTTFHMFIANLCVIDFLTATAMMPFNVNAYVTKTWPFGKNDFSCSFMAFSYYCCGYSSIVCLMTITVNRFVGIVYPEKYDSLFTRRRIWFIIVISWLFAPAFMLPFFFFSSDGTVRGYGWVETQTLCVFQTKKWNIYYRDYMLFTRILFQFLPLVCMIVLYAIIFKTSKNAGSAVRKLTMEQNSSNKSASRRVQAKINTSQERHRVDKSPVSSPSSIEMKKLDEEENKQCQSVPPLQITSYNINDENQPNLDTAAYTKAAVQNKNIQSSETRDLSECGTSPLNKVTPSPRLHSSELVKAKHCGESIHEKPHSPSIPLSHKPGTSSTNSFGTQPNRSRLVRRCTVMETAIKRRKRMDQRLLRISVTICVAFMILFSPSIIVNFIHGVNPVYHRFASIITWLNSCVNPIIYCFMNAKMRHQYKLLVKKAWNTICRCMSIENNDRVVVNKSFKSSGYRSSLKR